MWPHFEWFCLPQNKSFCSLLFGWSDACVTTKFCLYCISNWRWKVMWLETIFFLIYFSTSFIFFLIEHALQPYAAIRNSCTCAASAILNCSSYFSSCLYFEFVSLNSSAISVELYYIFATVWGREQYTLYGILLIVYAILISVTACMSVALVYFQLSAEDYRWWWRSVCSAGLVSTHHSLLDLFRLLDYGLDSIQNEVEQSNFQNN